MLHHPRPPGPGSRVAFVFVYLHLLLHLGPNSRYSACPVFPYHNKQIHRESPIGQEILCFKRKTPYLEELLLTPPTIGVLKVADKRGHRGEGYSLEPHRDLGWRAGALAGVVRYTLWRLGGNVGGGSKMAQERFQRLNQRLTSSSVHLFSLL